MAVDHIIIGSGINALVAAAMLGLLIANSLLLLFICWELVGLASYLLIGFWYEKPSANAAAMKAFVEALEKAASKATPKANNPAVPITIAEQVEITQAAFEAGASIAHCHVRDDEGKPTSDPDRFARLVEGLKTHCPGMIIQLSTGGRSGAGAARGGMLPLRPDMASLSVGSNNFPTRVYENPPDLVDWLAAEMLKYNVKPEIECFDLSHIVQAASMARDGRLANPLYVQFVMGVKNAMPADERIFDFYIETLNRLAPTALWCAAGIGPAQLTINEWAIAKGGHTRTGMEDNVRLDRDRLAMLLAVLHRHAGVACGDQDVFVNAVGGVRISEPAADLAVMLAITSSLRGKPLPKGFIAFGEVGLAGEVRPAPRGQDRLKEAAKLGFKVAVVPKANAPKKNDKAFEGLTIYPVDRIEEAMQVVRGLD